MSSDVLLDLNIEGSDIAGAEVDADASKSWRRPGWHLLGARIPEDLYERLSWGAYRNAVSINKLLSDAAVDYLDRNGIDEPPEAFVRQRRAVHAEAISRRAGRQRRAG